MSAGFLERITSSKWEEGMRPADLLAQRMMDYCAILVWLGVAFLGWLLLLWAYCVVVDWFTRTSAWAAGVLKKKP